MPLKGKRQFSKIRKLAEVVGSTPTRSISSNLVGYGIILILFSVFVGENLLLQLAKRKGWLKQALTDASLCWLCSGWSYDAYSLYTLPLKL
jgi:hypothetical protein